MKKMSAFAYGKNALVFLGHKTFAKGPQPWRTALSKSNQATGGAMDRNQDVANERTVRGSSIKEDPYGRPYIDAGENTEAFAKRVRRDLKEWKGIREKQKAKEGT